MTSLGVQGCACGLLVALATLIATAPNDLRGDLLRDGEGVEVFVTGNEQSLIERFAGKASAAIEERFSNSLDHAFAVLLAKAYPVPSAMRLAEETVGALCEEGERHTRREAGAAQRNAWVRAVAQSRSFASVLEQLAVPATNSEQVVKAGLSAMVRASGWDGACLLSRTQADELKMLLKGRQSVSEERGVLGVKLDRWPVIDVVERSNEHDAILVRALELARGR